MYIVIYRLQDAGDSHTYTVSDKENFTINLVELLSARIFNRDEASRYTISLTAYDQSDSSLTKEFTITVVDVAENSLDNSRNKSEVNIWPVPAKDLLHLNFPAGKYNNLKLFSHTGKLICQKKIEISSYETLDISALAPGSYIIILSNKTGMTCLKNITKN